MKTSPTERSESASHGREEVVYGLEIVLNDPDPCYGAQISAGGDCLLRITADPRELGEIEERLRDSGLAFEELRRRKVEG